MKRPLSFTSLAVCVALAGCDAPIGLAPPSLAGAWAADVPASDTRATIRAMTFEPGGTFVAELGSVAGGETRKLTGRWSAAADWSEPSCWDRAWERPSQLEELEQTRTGKRPERLRTSRASVRLQYWVPKGTEVPTGAKVVRKEVASASPGRRSDLGPAGRLIDTGPAFRPPAGEGEHWLLEEDAALIRTAVTGTKTTHLVGQLFAAMGECLLGGEEDVKTGLALRRLQYRKPS